MLAAYARNADADQPLNALVVGELEPPATPPDWVEIEVRAAALNHHDIWALRGAGLKQELLPMVLGTDAAGVTADGREVVAYAVINDPGYTGIDETHDPKRSLFSERYPGTLATRLRVPSGNLIDKPSELSFAEAACLPTAWLTAYRMLFTQSGLRPGDTVLIQGAGGGVSTALITLARRAGMRVWVTSRDLSRGERAVEMGAHQAFTTGERLPDRVDAVMESVGAPTWSHSINALRPGGSLVICGTTAGDNPDHAELTKIFFKPLRVIGSTMGSRAELAALMNLLVNTGIRPTIDRTLPLADAREGLAAMVEGNLFGKVVIEP